MMYSKRILSQYASPLLMNQSSFARFSFLYNYKAQQIYMNTDNIYQQKMLQRPIQQQINLMQDIQIPQKIEDDMATTILDMPFNSELDNDQELNLKGRNSKVPKKANHGARPCSSVMRKLKRVHHYRYMRTK